MNGLKPQLYFLLAFLSATVALSFFVFKPFLYALILATVFAVVFQPVHNKILNYTKGKQGLSAFLTTLVVVVLIFIPLTFIGVQIFQESLQLYTSLVDGNGKDSIIHVLNAVSGKLHNIFPPPIEFSVDFDSYLKQALGWLLQNLGYIFSNFAKILMSTFVFLIALYYLLKDGQKIKTDIIKLSPLNNKDDESILVKLERTINAVVRGNILIALLQGILTMIGFYIFGVPNAVIWGTVASIAAFIPGIGTALVLTPAVIFLFLTGNIVPAIGMLVWSILAVGLVDNFLSPKLIGRGMRLHPLLVLFAVLGGLSFFGPLGILLGPLTLSFLFALGDTYSDLIKSK